MSKGLFQSALTTRQGIFPALFSKGGDAPRTKPWDIRLGEISSKDLVGIPLWLLFLAAVSALVAYYRKR